MPTKDKRLKKARDNPKNVRFETLCRILKDYGFEIRSGGKGSHFIATLPGSQVKLTLAKHIPMKSVYVKKAIELIDEILWNEE